MRWKVILGVGAIMCPDVNPKGTSANSVSIADGSAARTDASHVQNELTALSDIVGRKWSLVIVDEIRNNGPLGFSDLLESIDSISSKVLSESLDDLEGGELVNREIVSERPFRVEYSLTEQASGLESVIQKVHHEQLSVGAAAD